MVVKTKNHVSVLFAVFLILICSDLKAQQHYHGLNVRIINQSGFDISLYMNVSGHAQVQNAPSSICIGPGHVDLRDGAQYVHRCNIRSTSPTIEKLNFHGLANCYPKEGSFQAASYRFPDRSSGQRYYTIGPRGNAPLNQRGEYVFTFRANMFSCTHHTPDGYKRALKHRVDP